MTGDKEQARIVQGVLTTRIYDLVRETPLDAAPGISRLARCRVLLKREDLQQIFSFKTRGAYHKMTRLAGARLRRGVVAASAGNHAQGVALAARHLGCAAAIVMPRHTPRIKVNAVKKLGGRVILHGENFDEAQARANEEAKKSGAVFIPPFDDDDVIAGNATVAAEILRQHPQPISALFCAVGGGGLIAGVAAYIKAVRPEIKIIGVEPEEAAGMNAAFAAGKPVTLPRVGLFADSVAVKKAGARTFRLARRFVDEMIIVNNDEICAAIKDIYLDRRAVVEPAGALAVAGIKRARRRFPHAVVALVCGANMNFDRLRFVAERAEVGEQREALLAATIPERPGSFRRFCNLIGRRNVTEFNYRLADPNNAHIFVGVEVASPAEKKTLVSRLNRAGLGAVDLTENEMAKLHVRHMVGGRARAENERLYRFEFPERPGALVNFLNAIGDAGLGWNISLFHYRNHGADVGRVLAGIQVPRGDLPAFRAMLARLGYPHREESDNPAYRLFLRGG